MSEGCNFGKKFALLTVLFTGLVQAEKHCDADPRYLLVTVLAEHTWIRNIETDKLEKESNFSSATPRPVLLDRCDNIDFVNASNPSVYFPDERIAKSEVSEYVSEGRKIKTWKLMRVKESLSDLCRVMKDCGDATK